MIDASDDINQYFPAGLDGAAKLLEGFLWNLWISFLIIHF
jgi:hypothetical protein